MSRATDESGAAGVESASSAAGSTMVNVVPAPGCDCTSIVPPAFWTMLWLMASPSPVPCVFVVKNGIEQVAQDLRRDARPGVAHAHLDELRLVGERTARRGRPPRRAGGTAPARERRTAVDTVILPRPIHRLDRVLHQVHENLAELLRVDARPLGSGSAEIKLHVDGAVGDLAREDLHRAAHGGVHVERDGIARVRAARSRGSCPTTRSRRFTSSRMMPDELARRRVVRGRSRRPPRAAAPLP